MNLLEGKAIVITGSGRGIGAACAERAAGLGAHVVINDLDADIAEAQAEKIRTSGGTAISHAADICDWDQSEALIEACVDRFGRIDGLVNNAGLFAMGRLEEMDRAELTAMLKVNVSGAAYCASHSVRRMLEQGSGSIVNIVSGAQMGIPAMGSYGASKGAIASFTYAWAAELQGTGVRVNAVSPLAATRMVEATVAYQRAHDLPAFEAGQPPADTNAPAICFLLSDLSSDINGQILRSEGQQIALVAHPVITHPIIEREDWNEVAIAECFADELKHKLSPVGIFEAKVEYIGSGSGFWKNKE